MMQRIVSATAVLAALLLAGCGSFSLSDTTKVDYRSTCSTPTLEIPPDLTMPAFDERYRDRPGSATASGMAAGAQPARSGVLPVLDVGRIERAGAQRWVVVQGTPEATWSTVREFWMANGFTMALERPDLGLMETDWAENKALLPQNWFRKQMGKVMDIVYDTGERDRFRTRIERGTQMGTVEIFISHRGMMEVPTSKDGLDYQWKMKESNPELEAEMLQRLLVRLGTPAQAAQAALVKPVEVSAGKVDKRADGVPMLVFVIRSTGPGAGSGWRSTGWASPSSTATAPRASISSVMSIPKDRPLPKRTTAGCPSSRSGNPRTRAAFRSSIGSS